MNTYYCEIIGNETNPHFPGYKHEAKDDETAILYFKQRHGIRLELVYREDNDNMVIVWQDDGP